ncbi:MAG: AAA family ATPase [Phycisphaerales bacterium]|nr:AAA family ATPase [Phycisphaerales bacterium]
MAKRPNGQAKSVAGAAAPLPVSALRWRCDPSWVPFATTDDVEPVHGIVGQDFAAEALRFGLATAAPGHHVFVRGLAGTGRVTLVRSLMAEIQPLCPLSRDRCFVRNFAQTDRPRLLNLPRGQGPEFVRLMDEFAEFVRRELRPTLNSEMLRNERDVLDNRFQHALSTITGPFENEVRQAGLAFVTIGSGPSAQTRIAPVVEGKPVPPESLDELVADGRLSEEEARAIRDRAEQFTARLAQVAEHVQSVQNDHEEEARSLVKRQVRAVLVPIVDRIVGAFPQDGVRDFLDEVLTDASERRLREIEAGKDFTRLYRVNLAVRHPRGEGCPVVLEVTPSLPNLLGTIDREVSASGRIRSDHMMIRAGSLLRADGGFLLLEAREVLAEPGAWRMLMRTLRTGKLEIIPPEMAGPWGGRTITPEAVDLNVKIVLIGDDETYAFLDATDPDFPHLFKVLVDFDSTIDRSAASAGVYASVVSRIARDEHLPPFDAEAVAGLVEHGARVAARAGKLTAQFGRVGDVAREAAFVANETGATRVGREQVGEAVRRARRRADLPARRFRDLVRDGTLRVRLSGTAIGQVNGLAVVHAGPLVYGFPQRITATVAPGGGGMINIDREAELSGAIHTKGFYILAGLLRTLLQVDHPLVFDASIAFEQSYGGIDGDSASAAETAALLSALTTIPIRQDLAITGAIDQTGLVMSIGAVNEKIEGFFDACVELGLTGTQGVIIPRADAGDLMLREDVVDACAAGQFRVHGVDTIHEAVSVLTNRPAGMVVDGTCAPGTVLSAARAQARLFWEAAGGASSSKKSRRPARGRAAESDTEDEASV